jgi:hypothetical protein
VGTAVFVCAKLFVLLASVVRNHNVHVYVIVSIVHSLVLHSLLSTHTS